ncbi:MAG TPA: DEAD/DEAH box helicase [Vitreimonas sp.]|nr:DEAD/DEAH box helicase [Vitreimonas sp.]
MHTSNIIENTYKTPGKAHQLKALELGAYAPYFAYLMEMGTGKSWVYINNIAWLYRAKEIGAAIYLAPKGAYRDFCDIQIQAHMPEDIPYELLIWQSPLPKDWDERVKRAYKSDKLVILCMNVESLAYDSGQEFLWRFIEKVPGQIMMGIDESTCIKNHKTKRGAFLIKMGKYVKYRRIMSGSPITRSPLDMFGQAMFLSSKALGFTSYYAFRARYAVMREQKLTGGRTIPIVTGYQRLDELKDVVKRFSFRVLKKDCLDLPPKIYQYRDVELTKEQIAAYKQLAKEGVAYLGEEHGTVTAVGTLALLTRLQQVTCGFIGLEDGSVLDLPSKRLDTLMETVEQVSGKAIIWSHFTHNIRQIIDALRKEYGDESVVHYYGATTDDERALAKNRFQNDPKCRFFVGNPATGRYSLTLTKATTVIYFSNSYDLEFRNQSEDRAHRIGQDESVVYIDLVSRKTTDELIYKSLKMKIDIASSITGDDLKEWLVL